MRVKLDERLKGSKSKVYQYINKWGNLVTWIDNHGVVGTIDHLKICDTCEKIKTIWKGKTCGRCRHEAYVKEHPIKAKLREVSDWLIHQYEIKFTDEGTKKQIYRDLYETRMKKKRDRVRNRMLQKKYMKQRMKKDKDFNLKIRLRTNFSHCLRTYTKTGKVLLSKEYGIDYDAIIKHLKPFPKDISKYHVDHIRPLCSFKFVNKDGSNNLQQIKEAFKPENHQWLLARENLKKGSKMPMEVSA